MTSPPTISTAGLAPGVRFQWIARPAPPGLPRTDIAGFVGMAERGDLNTPTRIESPAQFTSTFGRALPGGYLADAVRAFFANGGTTCWIVRVANPVTATTATLDLAYPGGPAAVQLRATSPGTWAGRIAVTCIDLGSGRFTLALELADEGLAEQWRDLSFTRGDPRAIDRVLAGSALVEASILDGQVPPAAAGDAIRMTTGQFSGGDDGLDNLAAVHFSGEGAPGGQRWGLATLELIDEISIVAMPDAARLAAPPAPPPPPPVDCSKLTEPPVPTAEPDVELTLSFEDVLELSNALIRHCIQLQDRIAMLDPPTAAINANEIIEWRKHFTSSYGALYFPWILVASDSEDPKPLPPSGAMAGILARVSLRDSCAKPPANEPLAGVAGLVARVDELIHSRLNDYSVNAIRTVAGRGLRVLGARTCLAPPGMTAGPGDGRIATATPDPSGLGFLNVRRVVTMVEAVVATRLQLVVFEGNVPSTWQAIERSVRTFLDGLWRRGGLDGASASDAYFVRCDATTNPEVDIEQGRLTCVVGIRPPWPAEFVFVRVSATAAGTRVQEGSTDA